MSPTGGDDKCDGERVAEESLVEQEARCGLEVLVGFLDVLLDMKRGLVMGLSGVEVGKGSWECLGGLGVLVGCCGHPPTRLP